MAEAANGDLEKRQIAIAEMVFAPMRDSLEKVAERSRGSERASTFSSESRTGRTSRRWRSALLQIAVAALGQRPRDSRAKLQNWSLLARKARCESACRSFSAQLAQPPDQRELFGRLRRVPPRVRLWTGRRRRSRECALPAPRRASAIAGGGHLRQLADAGVRRDQQGYGSGEARGEDGESGSCDCLLARNRIKRV